MAMQPEMERAVEDICNEAIVYDERRFPVDLVLDHAAMTDDVKESVAKEFRYILRMLDFQNRGYEIFRRWYVDGKGYYHMIVDPKNVKKVFEAFDDIIEDLKKGNFKNKYFQDAKTKRLLRTKQSLKGNSIWTGGLLDYTFNQENIQIIGNLETVIQSISKRDVVRIANQLLDKNYIQSVLLPKD